MVLQRGDYHAIILLNTKTSRPKGLQPTFSFVSLCSLLIVECKDTQVLGEPFLV